MALSSVSNFVTEVLEAHNITEYPNATEAPFFPNGLRFHPHWEKYRHMIEDIPAYAHYIVGLVIGFICIIGIVSNAVVIYIFTT